MDAALASREGLDRRIALERNDAARKALGDAVDEIDALAGNELYRKAWKKAIARIVLLMKREHF